MTDNEHDEWMREAIAIDDSIYYHEDLWAEIVNRMFPEQAKLSTGQIIIVHGEFAWALARQKQKKHRHS